MGDTIRGRRRDEPFNPFAPGASQQARKRTEDRRKSESADNAAQSKPVMSIAERRKRSLEALKNKQKESKTAIDDKEEVSAPITEGISLPQQPLQQKTESASPALPDRRSQLEARTAASVETSKQVMEEKKNIETDNSPLVEKLTEDEKNSLKILCQGAAIRFLLTRVFDYLNLIEGALVKIKDPIEYLKRLEFHNKVKNYQDYFF